MNTLAYALNASDIVLTHGMARDLLLQDRAYNDEVPRTRAQVASGDYFETLAVEPEQIAAALPHHSVEQYQLQDCAASYCTCSEITKSHAKASN